MAGRWFFVLLFVAGLARTSTSQEPPNFIVFVADDMAWLDVMAWVVTPRLFAVSAPAAIAVFLSTAVIDWAGASFA